MTQRMDGQVLGWLVGWMAWWNDGWTYRLFDADTASHIDCYINHRRLNGCMNGYMNRFGTEGYLDGWMARFHWSNWPDQVEEQRC